MKVIVVGAAGYVGHTVVLELLDSAHCSRILCVLRTSLLPNSVCEHPNFAKRVRCLSSPPNEWEKEFVAFSNEDSRDEDSRDEDSRGENSRDEDSRDEDSRGENSSGESLSSENSSSRSSSPDARIENGLPITCVHYGFFQRSGKEHELLSNQITMEFLLRALQKVNARLIFGSSVSVLGQGPFVDLNETAVPAPKTALARSRLACECLIRNSGVPHVILRTRFILGGADSSTAPGLLRLGKKRLMLASGEQKLSYIHVNDLARIVLWLSLETVWEQNIFHVAQSAPVTFRKVVQTILRKHRYSYKPLVKIPCYTWFFSFLSRLPFETARNILTKLQLFGTDQIVSNQRLKTHLRASFSASAVGPLVDRELVDRDIAYRHLVDLDAETYADL